MTELSAETLRSLVEYQPENGHFFWKARGDARWDGAHAGKRAGNLRVTKPHGYTCRQIRILGKNYYEHRLAWLFMSGEWPKDQIDHVNRDATDNAWKNLRESDNSSNHRNQSRRSNNTSGVVGVTWNKNAGKWQAQTTMHGKCHYHGVFESMEDAASAALSFRSANGFSISHGKHPAHYKTEAA